MQIVKKNTTDLIPYANNSRKHSDKQIKQVASSIKEFGFLNPVIIDKDNGIIAGHCRVMACEKLGIKEVPCILADHLTEAQKKAYVIADNQLALNSEWNMDLLKVEIEGLQDLNFDVDLLGFDDDFLNELDLGTKPIVDEEKADEVPEVEENPVIKLGDLIELGHNYQHRVLCGDSTKEEDVARLMNGNKADMVFTDPPYNVNAESRSKKGIDKIKNDNMGTDEFAQFLYNTFLLLFNNTKQGAVAYIWHNHKEQITFETSLVKTNWKIKSQIVWNKDIPSYSTNLYRQKHELCFFCVKDKELDYGHKSDTVWSVPSIQSAKSIDDKGNSWFKGGSRNLNLHVTQKPTKLAENGICHQSKAGDIILDLFLGSGTTLIASENLSRNCCGMELDEKYAQVIIQRYVDYTNNPMIKINGQEVDWHKYKEANNG